MSEMDKLIKCNFLITSNVKNVWFGFTGHIAIGLANSFQEVKVSDILFMVWRFIVLVEKR